MFERLRIMQYAVDNVSVILRMQLHILENSQELERGIKLNLECMPESLLPSIEVCFLISFGINRNLNWRPTISSQHNKQE